MAGLSMVRMTAHRIFVANLDNFTYIGLISGGKSRTNEIIEPASFKKNMKVVFMSCGDREIPAAVQASHDALEKTRIHSAIVPFFVLPNAKRGWRSGGKFRSVRSNAVPQYMNPTDRNQGEQVLHLQSIQSKTAKTTAL